MALAALSFTSCKSDLLDTNPTDKVSGDTMLKTTDGGYMALNGMIRYFWQWGQTTTGNYHQCFGPQSYNLMADLMGEDMVMSDQGSGWFWFDYLYNVKSRWNSTAWRSYDTWNYYYTIISNANYIINGKEGMTGSTDDIDYIIGNAYAFRAYSYAYCAMIFARSYIGHEDRLSIPIYTEPTFAGTEGKARSTNREVFAQAMSDINEAITLLGTKARKHCSHFDQYVANGLKARIALYMGDYQTAHDAAAIAVKGGSFAFDKDFHYNDATDKSVLWGAEIIQAQGTTNPQFLVHMDIRYNNGGGYGEKPESARQHGYTTRWHPTTPVPNGGTTRHFRTRQRAISSGSSCSRILPTPTPVPITSSCALLKCSSSSLRQHAVWAMSQRQRQPLTNS